MQETLTYQTRSQVFLSKAREQLEAGDLEQASEKAWGAAALMVKAVAQARGLEHEKHGHLFGVVRVLATETSDRELRGLFHVANGMHSNFYENWLDADDVAEGLEDVERFVGENRTIPLRPWVFSIRRTEKATDCNCRPFSALLLRFECQHALADPRPVGVQQHDGQVQLTQVVLGGLAWAWAPASEWLSANSLMVRGTVPPSR